MERRAEQGQAGSRDGYRIQSRFKHTGKILRQRKDNEVVLNSPAAAISRLCWETPTGRY